MSSDKAPEKVYFNIDELRNHSWLSPYKDKEATVFAYIREDLTLDAKLKEPGAIVPYKTEGEQEAANLIAEAVKNEIAKFNRRREMFEKVALVYLARTWGGQDPTDNIVLGWAKITAENVLEAADEFARGE